MGNKAKPTFELIMLDEAWNMEGEFTTKYYEKNNQRLAANQSLELDFNDEKVGTDKTWRDLLYDFSTKFRQGKVESVDKYFESIYEANFLKLLVDAG